MSAKLEQPISPSFSRMIKLLTDEEAKFVSKQSLIELEAQILMKLGFDFNFQGPVQSMERYLRLLGYQSNSTVYDMAFQVCKFQLNDAQFLEYRPSEIAACSVILSINIYEEDCISQNDGVFFDGKIKGLLELNTNIWSDSVVASTGYSLEQLKPCLYDLAQFICENLSPNRLSQFNIEDIKSKKWGGRVHL